jgi:hypothetical protein
MNVTNSILFLTCARHALKEQVLLSELEESKKVAFSEFLVNEATDYEVMSLLVDNALPEEKYNQEAEAYLFADLKEMVIENYSGLSESIGRDSLMSLVYEIGPVSAYGYSTAAPILEFLLSEIPNFNLNLPRKSSSKKIFGAAAKAPGIRTKQVTMAAQKAGSALKGAPGQAKEFAKKQYGRASDRAKVYGGQAVEKAKAAGKWAGTHKKALGAAAIAAIAAYAGVKAYKKWFSASAKACAGKSGSEKDACVKQYKNKAVQAQIQATGAGAGACSKAKDPAKCKAQIQSRISSLKGKLG